MAVNIDDVYQKVLTLANKEQRGYITPQEFNLFADKAQLDIINNYFHNIKTAYHKRKTNMEYADEIGILSEKINAFKIVESISLTGDTNDIDLSTALTNTLHQLDTLSIGDGSEIVEVSRKDFIYIQNNPLTKTTANRMIYVKQSGSSIRVYPTPSTTTTLTAHYWRIPNTPNWSYIVVNEKALFNANLATNFDLHVSEEEHLVTRILQLAGVIIKQPDVQQSAIVDKQMSTQEKNN